MHFKSFFKLFILLVFLFTSFLVFSQIDSDIYSIVTSITSNGKPLTINIDDSTEKLELNDRVYSNQTILTVDNQSVELMFYKNNKPIGLILILENTDFQYRMDEKDNLVMNIIYGGIRGYVDENTPTKIESSTVFAETRGSDFAIVSTKNDKGQRKGYATLFEGKLKFISKQNASNKIYLKNLQISDFLEYKVFPPRFYTFLELGEWTEKMLFKTENIPDNLNPALETYTLKKLEDVEIADETTDTVIDETTDLVREDETADVEKRKIANKKLKYLQAFLSFEFGATSFMNNDIQLATKTVWRPGTSLFEDKFEFGFYFPANVSFELYPNQNIAAGIFSRVNDDNNEWSFGYDQNLDAGKMVWDIFDDLLLKVRTIRYNHEDDKIFVHFGHYFSMNDYMNYSMNDFNSPIFFPKYRKASLISRFNLSWFKAYVYAEDIMPKGLYGFETIFMTPAKSFKLNFKISGFIDFYDFIKFDNTESVFPAQFNTTISYDSFNVKSLFFTIYISAGYYIPFTYDFTTQNSSYSNLMIQNPSSAGIGVSSNTGFFMRIMNFHFGIEFIIDSGLNKIGLYDISYLYKRRYNRTNVLNWIDDMYDRNTVAVTDYNFGFRFKIGGQYLDHLKIESSYQLTFPEYYDKFYFRLTYDTLDKLKVNFAFYVQWQLENIPSLITDIMNIDSTLMKNFQRNNVFYIGSVIRPHPAVDINIINAIYPVYYDVEKPWYNEIMVELSVAIKPYELYKKAATGL